MIVFGVEVCMEFFADILSWKTKEDTRNSGVTWGALYMPVYHALKFMMYVPFWWILCVCTVAVSKLIVTKFYNSCI